MGRAYPVVTPTTCRECRRPVHLAQCEGWSALIDPIVRRPHRCPASPASHPVASCLACRRLVRWVVGFNPTGWWELAIDLDGPTTLPHDCPGPGG
jgi:hypothetical protein